MADDLTSYRSIVWDNHRWASYHPRPGDIVVATPPKCGTTWTQTIVANLLFPDGDLPAPVMDLAPWIDCRFEAPIDEVMAAFDTQPHRRAMKTHTPADGIPWHETSRYIVVGRNGRDAFMSFVNHMSHMRPDVVEHLLLSAIQEGIELGEPPASPDDIHAFFAWWLREAFLFRFMATFWDRRDEPNVLFVHYNDLTADLSGQMRRIAGFLDVPIEESLWPAQVERCTFAAMKAKPEGVSSWFDDHFIGGAETFLYKGTNNRWQGVLTDQELAAYDARARELLAPDCLEWLDPS